MHWSNNLSDIQLQATALFTAGAAERGLSELGMALFGAAARTVGAAGKITARVARGFDKGNVNLSYTGSSVSCGKKGCNAEVNFND